MEVVKEIAAECTPLPSGPTDSFFRKHKKKKGEGGERGSPFFKSATGTYLW